MIFTNFQGKCQRWHRTPPTFSCPAGWTLISEKSFSKTKQPSDLAPKGKDSPPKDSEQSSLSETHTSKKASSEIPQTSSSEAAICVFEEETAGTLACASGFSFEDGVCVKRSPEAPESVCRDGFVFSPGGKAGTGECRKSTLEDAKPVCREGLYFHPAVGKCILEEEPSFECPPNAEKGDASLENETCGGVLVEAPELRCPADTAPLVLPKGNKQNSEFVPPAPSAWQDFLLQSVSPDSKSINYKSPTQPPPSSLQDPTFDDRVSPVSESDPQKMGGWQNRSWSSSASRSGKKEVGSWRRLFSPFFGDPLSGFSGLDGPSQSRLVCERLEVSEKAKFLRCPEGFQAELRSDAASSVCVRRLQKVAKTDCVGGSSSLQGDGLCADVRKSSLLSFKTVAASVVVDASSLRCLFSWRS